MVDKLAVAVIGCGGHGRGGHIAGWKRIEDVEVVAVCDIHRERAQRAAQEYDVPHEYDDPRRLLERHRPDIVSVATPPKFHKQNVVDAFAAGANVVCEKPLAMNAQEAEEMIRAARRAGKLMTMGLQYRMMAQGRYLQRFLADGGLGHIYHTRVWTGHLISSGIPGGGVFHRRELSGSGVLFATMVHLLDWANWVIGNPVPKTASGSEYQKISRMKDPPVTWAGRLEDCDVEDFSYGFVRFADGSSMSLESSWLVHPAVRPTGIDILGDYGKAGLCPLKIELDEGRDVKDVTPTDLVEQQPHYFVAVLQDFAECVREGRVPVVKFSEMLNVQKMMDAIAQSARMGREVEIPS